jgi:hypothetical protein
MKKTWIVKLALAAALFIPGYAQAIPIQINSITTQLNGQNIAGLNGPTQWNLPQLLLEGQSLQVGQIGPGFNFDTSDFLAAGCGTNPPACLATITVGTSAGNFVFTETFAALAGRQNGIDTVPNTDAFNEAAQYRLASLTSGTAGQLLAWTGYFDNSHTDVCTDLAVTTSGSTETAGNCRPDFNATFNRFTGATLTDGDGGLNFVTANPNHCFTGATQNSTQTNCFDNGMILIRNNTVTTTTPEPMSLMLLGSGLLGLVAFQRSRRRK